MTRRTVLDYNFETVRAKVADADSSLQKLRKEKTIVFGPGARQVLGEEEPDATE